MVLLDTNVLIYYLEGNSEHFEAARQAIEKALVQEGDIACSVISMTEIMRGVGEQNEIVNFFNQPQVKVLEITAQIAQLAGQIAYTHKYALPDALILASAIINDAHTLLTNDKTLLRWRAFPKCMTTEIYNKT